ncbi:component of the polarisome [Coemansia spiralis]|uniref:Component of the polarisome n=1 Tax=Coemansia spiralis TaxID=417178 RepID=A0A9W8L0K6_9FUNG|nr:component of the polarisome [Coemansia spiralis]
MEATAAQYHREMSKFIVDEIGQGIATPSKSEPGKLSRLSPMQFQELATDVYDELNRRRYEADATLSRPKFVDLVHDVNEELKRRFPHKIDVNQGYGPPSQTASYDSMNLSPMYNNLPSQQQQVPAQGYGQYQTGRSSPSGTLGSQAYSGYSQQGSSGIANDDVLNSVDRVANDLSNAIQNSQHGTVMRTPTPDERGLRSPTSEIEKLRNEYEMRIAAMRKRVGQLESQLLDYRGDNPQDINADQLENLERLNAVLTQKNERLENDLKIVREQLVAVKADIPALRQENDKLKQERARFIERERDLKSKLDEARAKLRKLKTTSVFAMDHGDSDLVPPPVFVNSGGVVRPSSVRAFQEAVEEMLSAVRSEDMQRELPAARSAVEMSCSELKADIHAYEIAHANSPDAWPLEDDIKKRIPSVVSELDANLRNLVAAVEKHMNSMGVLPVSFLEAAASHLATSVVEIVKLLKVCFDESKAAPRLERDASGQQSLEESTDNIIAGIQSMLQLVRAAGPDPSALYTSLETVIGSIQETISICRTVFSNIDKGYAPSVHINMDLYSSQTASGVLNGLEKGHLQLTDQLNDINEAQDAAGDNELDNEIVRELLSEMAFKQRLTSALIDVGKLTKTLVMWLE